MAIDTPGIGVEAKAEVGFMNPATSVLLDALGVIATELQQQNIRKEEPAPARVQLPAIGHLRLRVVTWHLHPAAVGVYALQVGLERKSTISITATATGGCIPEPLPITIEPGVNVTVIDAATGAPVSLAQVVDSFLMAFAEENP